MNVYSLAEHEGMVVESEPCHVKVKIVKLTMSLRSGTSRVCYKFSNYHRKRVSCNFSVFTRLSYCKNGKLPYPNTNIFATGKGYLPFFFLVDPLY